MNTTIKASIRKFKNFNLTVQITLVLFFLFFTACAFIQLYPFVWVLNNSLKGTAEYESTLEITREWQFINYISVFSEFVTEGGGARIDYWTMLWNSVWQTALYLFVNIGTSVLVAYCLAKFRFPGHDMLYFILIFTQTIPIIGTGAAMYKLKHTLGMINNPFSIWLQWAHGFDYSAFILYGIFKGISNSYTEAAKIDGASDLAVFWKIVLPQAMPTIVALLITNFTAKWNDYATTQISLWYYPTLAYGLFTYRKTSQYGLQAVYYAAIVVVSIPGILLYALFQNAVIKNIAVGGLKG